MRVVVIPIVLAALAFVTVNPSKGSSPQASKEAKIKRALQAAPASITNNAMIMDSDGTVLRQGSNGWMCMPDMGPGSSHPACSDKVWGAFFTAYGKHANFKADHVGVSYMLAGDDNVNNKDPYDKKQDPGEVWVQEGPHLMIVVPDPKALEGMSDDPNNGGPYVMWKGTPYAHIMVPVGTAKPR